MLAYIPYMDPMGHRICLNMWSKQARSSGDVAGTAPPFVAVRVEVLLSFTEVGQNLEGFYDLWQKTPLMMRSKAGLTPGHSERHDFSQHKRVWRNPINTNDGKQCWHLQRDFTWLYPMAGPQAIWYDTGWQSYDMLKQHETAPSIVVPCSSQPSNRWSCSDFAMWGGSSHWSTRSCVRALERMKHHETSQFHPFPPFVAANCPKNSYHSLPLQGLQFPAFKNSSSLPPLSGCVARARRRYAPRICASVAWRLTRSTLYRVRSTDTMAGWSERKLKRKFQECSHQRNDAKLHLFSTLHYPLQQPMAYRLKPPGHHLQPARHQPQRQNLRYLSLLPAVRLDDANTQVMCKHPKHPDSQFLNLSWVYAQLHYIQAHLEPHHNCWWSSIFPPCLLVF